VGFGFSGSSQEIAAAGLCAAASIGPVRKGLRHLWTGDWRVDSDSAREAAKRERAAREAAARRERQASEPQPRHHARRSFGRPARAAIAVAAAALLVVVAFAAGALVDGGDDGASTLPAVSDSPVKPSQGQTRASAVYASASPAVVSIRGSDGSGTGFLIDRQGSIVTNSHVVGTGKQVTVRFGSDSNSVPGNVLGTDPSSDLAVVRIDASAIPSGVQPLKLADSRTVRVGDVAIAIGNPFGLDRTATEGIVSGTGRDIQAPNGFSIDSAIQTDAPINPGNSGGPLLNDSGRVIGVNSQITTGGTQGNVGIGFAVPSNTVRQVAPVLMQGGTIKRAYLGVETSPASAVSPSGARVESVVSGGPSERGGVQQGDVIKRVDGNDIREPSDISQAIAGDKPGDEIEVEIERGGTAVTLRVTLGTRPAATP
jgi:S1-C subfamily serine protease